MQRRGPLRRLLAQLHNPLIYVLLASAAATYALGETVDASVILAVVVANAVIGFAQETRAERALDALAQMVTAEALVDRDGGELRVPAKLVVPGDVVVLSPGDRVAADLRLLDAERLTIDESALTGESVPVAKARSVLPRKTVLADRANMGFLGTLVTAGRGRGLVVATGADTELGHIHRLLGETIELATPLTRRLARFARALTVAILALAAVTFAIGSARGLAASEMLVAAVALAVGAIPEGLPAAVTIALAIGVGRMARRHAIVRRLPAVETLGSATVICTDKTGTLTQNAMRVSAIVAGGRRYEVGGAGYVPAGEIRSDGSPVELAGEAALRACLTVGMLCGEGDVRERDGRWEPVGDPTEAALVAVARTAGLDRTAALGRCPRTAILPFDSERRYMATVHRDERGGERTLYVKGAPERVVAMCDRRLGAGGGAEPLDERAARAAAHELGARGNRVLALALRVLREGEEADLERPAGLVLAGVQAMADPPRPEAVAAIRACREAGIAVKMITGDHAATAAAVAAAVGLTERRAAGRAQPASVVTGAELAACPDERLGALAAATSVFARVSAEQKLRLVEALQARGEVVTMTGDGVNDAPALKQADIGVAMGRSGTEVAREASDIVLADDNFASIEAAVEEGRHTFDNLRKFIIWTLPTNVDEGVLIFVAVLAGATLPVLPVQVLWINMTTAVLLGLMLAFERVEPGIMARPPRRPGAPLLGRDVLPRMLLVSLTLICAAFLLFEQQLARGAPTAEARTVAVNVFVAVEIAYLFSCRSLTGRARDLGLLSNRPLLAGVALMVVLQLAFTFWTPMNRLFGSAPPEAAAWLWIAAAAAVAWGLVEVEKALRRRAAGRAGPRGRRPAGLAEPGGPDDRVEAGAGAQSRYRRAACGLQSRVSGLIRR